MPTMGDKLWEIGKSPPQNLTFLVFGLFSLLAGLVLRQYSAFIMAGPALSFVAAALAGIGAFFLATALFLAAFVGVGENGGPGLRIAALVLAVLVVLILL